MMRIDNRGIALLLTLSVITVMIAGTLELNRRVRATIPQIAVAGDRIIATQMTVSGIHIAMALLSQDKMESDTDSLQESWADEKHLQSLLEDFSFDDGALKIRISDELGKIQVNAVVDFPNKNKPNDRQLFFWERFITLFIQDQDDFGEIDPRSIVNSIKDWIDTGDDDAVTGLSGAESDYYLDLEFPYPCANDIMRHVNELARVRGVTPELYHGIGDRKGIQSFVTVHGMSLGSGASLTFPGKINISTAPLPVVAAVMPEGYEDLAQVIIDYREEATEFEYVNDISTPSWYTNVPGFSILEGELLTDFKALITVVSDVFTIDATAEVNAVTLSVRAVIQREKDAQSGKVKCKIITWENI